jgi:hypothetical protein
MSIEKLDNLVKIGQLKVEAADQAELDGLMHSGAARIKDAERSDLSFESRFDLAYSAAHAFSLAALRFHGYPSESRYHVFQTLQQTVQLKPEEWRVLDRAHSVRNRSEYEGQLDPDQKLLESLLRIARDVEKHVLALGPIGEPRTG